LALQSPSERKLAAKFEEETKRFIGFGTKK